VLENNETTRSYIRTLFRDEDAPAAVTPAKASPQPTTGPVIHGQEQMPAKVQESPLREFTRQLFDN